MNTLTRKSNTILLLTLIASLFTFTPFTSANTLDTEAELKKRITARKSSLLSMKSAGKVGETTKGLIEAVKPSYLKDAAVKKLITNENADRLKVYKLIAAKQKVSADSVAKLNAKRNFTKAAKGHYLKSASGVWKQKK